MVECRKLQNTTWVLRWREENEILIVAAITRESKQVNKFFQFQLVAGFLRVTTIENLLVAAEMFRLGIVCAAPLVCSNHFTVTISILGRTRRQ
jgi:hypothetical protein